MSTKVYQCESTVRPCCEWQLCSACKGSEGLRHVAQVCNSLVIRQCDEKIVSCGDRLGGLVTGEGNYQVL